MSEKLKRKPKEEQARPDVIPKHIMPNREYIIALGYSESKQYFDGFLEGLTRTQLMDFQDSKQFDGTAVQDAACECANNAEWERDYPMGKDEFEERIPEIVYNCLHEYKLADLVKQVKGMQTKLDKIETLISNTEFKLCGKDALKL